MKRTLYTVAFIILLLPCCERSTDEPTPMPVAVESKSTLEQQVDFGKARLNRLIMQAESLRYKKRTITTVRASDPVPH